VSAHGHEDAAPRKRLPLHDRHLGAGARMMPFAGWDMPLQYTGIVAEHEAVRTQAGVFDVSHMGRVWVRGADAAQRIRSVSTYDTTQIPVGGTHYSLYCNEAGGIDDDVFIFHVDADRWLIVHNAANAEADAARVAAAAGDAARDVGRETVMLAVQGPQAVDIVSRVVSPVISDLAPRTCAEVDWNGAALILSRTGYTGEDGAEIVAPPDEGAALWDALLAGGAQPTGLGCRETLRLEAALPLHGNDISPETMPHEARLNWAVTLDDGAPFTGRDALARHAGERPAKRLAHLRMLERGVPRAGYNVFDADGNPAGTLTSGAFSPTLRTGIAMGYFPYDLTRPGTGLAVEVRGQRIPAEVVQRPFYRRKD
jgi:aminomethyltransferase